jgi:hypothetical protein
MKLATKLKKAKLQLALLPLTEATVEDTPAQFAVW